MQDFLKKNSSIHQSIYSTLFPKFWSQNNKFGMQNKAIFMLTIEGWFHLKGGKEKSPTNDLKKIVKQPENYKRTDSTITHHTFEQKPITVKFLSSKKPPMKRPLDLTAKKQMDIRTAVKKEEKRRH